MTRHRRRGWSGITVTDQFCGAGGSTIGAKRAGVEVRLAMNHWDRAVETYNTNHPDTDVHCADVSAQDPRRFPSTDMLLTSPECTTHSPAGGNRRSKPQRDMFVPHVDDPALVRSRATMWDVPRFAEFHEYNIIIAENVVEVTRWPLFMTWLQAMHVLGYEHQIVSHNSMHSHPTPQSRDRVYIVFWKKGNRRPDLDIRPSAPCPKCESVVAARQTWKNGRTIGKYKTQYVFTCPTCRSVVVPFYYAALNAIDFSLPAGRIGDRSRPLKERTLERIRYGLEKYGNRHLIIRTNFTSGLDTRVRTLGDPMFGQTASWLDGIYAPFGLATPFVVPIQGRADRARSLADELPTQVAECPHDALISPSLMLHMHADGLRERVRDARTDPLATQTARQDFGFVFNVAGRDSMASLDRPLPTQETREKFAVALVDPAFIAVLRTHNRPKGMNAPLDTIATGGGHHLIIQGGAQLSMRDADAMRVDSLERELMTQGAAPQQAILQNAPFLTTVAFQQHAQGSWARGLDEPTANVVGNDRDALVGPSPNVEDCYFRMLQPHEIGAAMAFPADYKVTGNKRDQVKQFGNAVTPPAMDELVRRCIASLAPETAA